MADAVGTQNLADVIGVVELMRGAVVLDDIERMPDRYEFGMFFDVLGEFEQVAVEVNRDLVGACLLYTSPSPRDS